MKASSIPFRAACCLEFLCLQPLCLFDLHFADDHSCCRCSTAWRFPLSRRSNSSFMRTTHCSTTSTKVTMITLLQPNHQRRVPIHRHRRKDKAINKIPGISFLSFCLKKQQISSCECVIISLSGSTLSLGTEAVESLPKLRSPSAHSRCYATANYFHSAPRKTRREKGKGGVDKIQQTEGWRDGQTGTSERKVRGGIIDGMKGRGRRGEV